MEDGGVAAGGCWAGFCGGFATGVCALAETCSRVSGMAISARRDAWRKVIMKTLLRNCDAGSIRLERWRKRRHFCTGLLNLFALRGGEWETVFRTAKQRLLD